MSLRDRAHSGEWCGRSVGWAKVIMFDIGVRGGTLNTFPSSSSCNRDVVAGEFSSSVSFMHHNIVFIDISVYVLIHGNLNKWNVIECKKNDGRNT